MPAGPSVIAPSGTVAPDTVLRYTIGACNALTAGDATNVVIGDDVPAGTTVLRAAEAAGDVLNASVFGGFPLADMANIRMKPELAGGALMTRYHKLPEATATVYDHSSAWMGMGAGAPPPSPRCP